jgi:hypothetical protein
LDETLEKMTGLLPAIIVLLQLTRAQLGKDVYVERMEVVNGEVKHYDKQVPVKDSIAKFEAQLDVPMDGSLAWEDYPKVSEDDYDLEGDISCLKRVESWRKANLSEISPLDPFSFREPTKGELKLHKHLFFALKKGRAECVKLLVNYGSNASFVLDGSTPLVTAAHIGLIDQLQYLVRHASKENKKHHLKEASSASVVGKQYQEWLNTPREARAVGKLTAVAETPLYAACHNGNLEAVNILLAQGADPNMPIVIKKSHVDTPLKVAVMTKRLDIAQALIKKEADVNLVTNTAGENGPTTALLLAAFVGKKSLVRLLIKKGRSP